MLETEYLDIFPVEDHTVWLLTQRTIDNNLVLQLFRKNKEDDILTISDPIPRYNFFDDEGRWDAKILGVDHSGNVFISNIRGNTNMGNNVTILKYNEVGNLIWEKSFGNNNKNENIADALVIGEELVVVGFTSNLSSDITNNWVFSLDTESSDVNWERISNQNGLNSYSSLLFVDDHYYLLGIGITDGSTYTSITMMDLEGTIISSQLIPNSFWLATSFQLIDDHTFIISGFNDDGISMLASYSYNSEQLIWETPVFGGFDDFDYDIAVIDDTTIIGMHTTWPRLGFTPPGSGFDEIIMTKHSTTGVLLDTLFINYSAADESNVRGAYLDDEGDFIFAGFRDSIITSFDKYRSGIWGVLSFDALVSNIDLIPDPNEDCGIFPNPIRSKEILKFTSTSNLRKIKLINLLGEVIWKEYNVNNTLNIDLPAGNYFIEFEINNSRCIESLIVK